MEVTLPIEERLLHAPAKKASLIVYALAVLGLCIVVGVLGFRITEETNHNTDEFDQGAYIQMAGQMKNSWYPWYTDGTRNPLFPWLAARIFDPASPDFFAAGKRLNVVIAILGAFAFAAFFITRMGPLAAFNATAIAALAVLLPASAFFGAEVSFFVLFLFVCACAMRLLNENPPWLYAILAVLSGLAYLAKPSATPFLGLFFMFSFLRLTLLLAPPQRVPWFLRTTRWSAKNFLWGVALFGVIYIAIISPRLIHAQRTWGSASYSLPAFWFWADDWDTCVRKYADCRKVTLAKLPPEEQPTLSGYFHRHTVGDAFGRVATGASVRLTQLFYPEKKWKLPYDTKDKPRRVVLPYRGFYLVGLFALVAVMGGFAAMRHGLANVGPVSLPVLLGFATFVLYTLAMGWYLPTGPGHRFIMTLYIPMLWMLIQGGEQLRQAARSRPANIVFLSAHAFIAVLIVSRALILVAGGNFERIAFAF